LKTTLEPASVFEVFTPTSRAKRNFVPRTAVTDNLVGALQTPGKQIIVYGESGSGKSTLLQKKLDEIYEGQITTRCHATSTFDQLVASAFDQMDAFYRAEQTAGRTSKVSAQLSAEISGIKAAIESGREASDGRVDRRVVPPQLTPQRLGELLGSLGLCWVLEDFHKVPAAEKKYLAQTLKIFSDLAGEFPALKVVAVGATDTARDVVAYDNEMRNRVAEVFVPLMTDAELSAIIYGGQVLLNINLGSLRDTFVTYAMGVASVCHQLALNACLNEGVLSTQAEMFVFTHDNLEPALQRWITEASDSLKATFERALRRHKIRRFDNTRLILRALAKGPLSGLLHAEVLRHVREDEPAIRPVTSRNTCASSWTRNGAAWSWRHRMATSDLSIRCITHSPKRHY
jgi:GTPase SAR1 family protein